jgi:hypothetical protein
MTTIQTLIAKMLSDHHYNVHDDGNHVTFIPKKAGLLLPTTYSFPSGIQGIESQHKNGHQVTRWESKSEGIQVDLHIKYLILRFRSSHHWNVDLDNKCITFSPNTRCNKPHYVYALPDDVKSSVSVHNNKTSTYYESSSNCELIYKSPPGITSVELEDIDLNTTGLHINHAVPGLFITVVRVVQNWIIITSAGPDHKRSIAENIETITGRSLKEFYASLSNSGCNSCSFVINSDSYSTQSSNKLIMVKADGKQVTKFPTNFKPLPNMEHNTECSASLQNSERSGIVKFLENTKKTAGLILSMSEGEYFVPSKTFKEEEEIRVISKEPLLKVQKMIRFIRSDKITSDYVDLTYADFFTAVDFISLLIKGGISTENIEKAIVTEFPQLEHELNVKELNGNLKKL